MAEREFDVIIFGASGYTGKLVAEYMNKQYGADESIKWAIAGRNKEKLSSVKQDLNLNEKISIIEVDSTNEESLDSMTSSAKCILTTVGPYQLYGSKLVKSCANNGTDYVDLTGEPGWMYEMINAHQDAARSSGARIVFSCGFDSIPFDLGVYFVQQAAKRKIWKTRESCSRKGKSHEWRVFWRNNRFSWSNYGDSERKT